MLAALALVCGPALERTGEPAAAAAAGLSAPGPAGSSAGTTAPAAGWQGALAIRPSRIAKAPTAGTADVALIEAAPAGPPGEVGALGIPLMVLRAYHLAADQLGVEQPSCRLPWWLLAGIGHTESGHAESGRLTADGTTRGRILGPRLNGGIPGDAIITDTDHGSLDGDTVYDRAVGPMQFIPSTWARWGTDGNDDGKADPSNIFDATLAAGRYLCADGRDLSTGAGLRAAVLSYNHSAPYLATVLAWGEAYRDGASAVPDSPLPVVSDVTKVRPPRSSRPPKHVSRPGSTAPSGTPSGQAPASHPGPSGSASATDSSSATTSPTPTATPSCSPSSPAPTDSASSSSAPVQSATGQAYTPTSIGSASGSLTGSAPATDSGSPTATPSGTASPSRPQSAPGQSATGQAATGQTTPTESGSATSSAPASCAP